MTYGQMETYAGIFALIFFLSMFLIIVFWAFRPGSKQEMDKHAQIPLNDD